MTPFAFLGLADDADERAIKSAYARRLREVRPDRDPAGFQQLHAAYKAALEMTQARATPARRPLPPVVTVSVAPAVAAAVVALDDDDRDEEAETEAAGAVDAAHAAPSPPSPPHAAAPLAWAEARVLPLPPPAPPAFDFERFFGQLRTLVREVGAAEITPWLQNEPAFWSLAQKSAVRQVLLNRLDQERVPMPVDCFDALLAFFDLDHVLAGVDAFALQRLRRQLHLEWELLPEKFAHLAARMKSDPPAVRGEKQLRQLLDEARRPLTWRGVLRWAGRPQHAGRFAKFAQRLSYGQAAELPREFDQNAIRFWSEVANTREPTWRTLGMTLLHSLVWGLLGGALFGYALAFPQAKDHEIALVAGSAIGGVCAVWTGYIAWHTGLNWLCRRERRGDPAWRYWLRLGVIPTLAVGGAALYAGVDPQVGVAPLLLALAVAYYLTAHLIHFRLSIIGHFVAFAVIAGFSLNSAGRYGCVLTALLAVAGWGTYCYKKALYRRI